MGRNLVGRRNSDRLRQRRNQSRCRYPDFRFENQSSFNPPRLQGAFLAALVARRVLSCSMPFDSRGLMLFDVARQKWEEIAKITLGFPNWSKNSDYIYFLHEQNEPSVMRVRLSDHKVERVADLKNFRQAGFFSIWLGLAPDDSPLLLRDTGTQEIYSLDWEAQ
jgi:hypothetical protein